MPKAFSAKAQNKNAGNKTTQTRQIGGSNNLYTNFAVIISIITAKNATKIEIIIGRITLKSLLCAKNAYHLQIIKASAAAVSFSVPFLV
jgi:hypothetical protein